MKRMLTYSAGNPAARHISTRPIEKEGGSHETSRKVSIWLNRCLQEQIRGKRTHVNCSKPKPNYMPMRLIEISSHEDDYELILRQTKGFNTQTYVALSYCWGGDQPVKSTHARLCEWIVNIPWDKLPLTIRDAVIVCQKLGIHFRWVDSLCILQDDPNEMAVEIAQMPDVYRNSTLTTAASRAAVCRKGFWRKGQEQNSLTQSSSYPIGAEGLTALVPSHS
jgi:hypothetical protein